MRDIFSKVMTGSMIAGAALLVAACGGASDTAANNTAMNGLESDPMFEGNDMGMNGMDTMNGTDMMGNDMGNDMGAGNMMGNDMGTNMMSNDMGTANGM